MRRRPLLSTTREFTRYCPETGDEVDVEVEVRGTWFPGESGTYYDPAIPPGVEDVHAVANGLDFQLSARECDWAAEYLAEEVEE